MTTVGEIAQLLERRYPPELAEDWDRVGLVCGDPESPVRRILLVVDLTEATAAEAVAAGADLVIAHHPLLLRGVHSVATTSAKGRVLHNLIRANIAAYTAHTNADSATDGVSDALAVRIGLTQLQPLQPAPTKLDRLVVYVPEAAADRVIDAVDDVIGPVLGDYRRCAWWTTGTGTFIPGDTANPAIGHRGEIATVAERRVDITIPPAKRAAAVAAMLAAHPYEEPAYDVIELAPRPSAQGLGRIGGLPQPVPFADFVNQVARALPATAAGVRGAGDPARLIEAVGVVGGAGDSLLAAATRAGVDAFLTADLRHHPASEHLAEGGPALVDAAHWATERPWLDVAAATLRQQLGDNVEVVVSDIVTDPWTVHSAQ